MRALGLFVVLYLSSSGVLAAKKAKAPLVEGARCEVSAPVPTSDKPGGKPNKAFLLEAGTVVTIKGFEKKSVLLELESGELRHAPRPVVQKRCVVQGADAVDAEAPEPAAAQGEEVESEEAAEVAPAPAASEPEPAPSTVAAPLALAEAAPAIAEPAPAPYVATTRPLDVNLVALGATSGGVIAAAVGLGLVLKAQNDAEVLNDDIDRFAAQRVRTGAEAAELEDRKSSINTLNIVGVTVAIVGVAGIAGGVYLFMTDDDEAMALSPLVLDGGGGLVLTGGF